MAFNEIIGHQRTIGWLQTAVTSNHLGHAYLFHGEPAIGKRFTAMALAQYLFCEAPRNTPMPDSCSACRSCHQVAQTIHPDLIIIQPEDQQKVIPKITIDQIRAIEHFVIYRPLVGSYKICLIDPADALTLEAANALLKTLEDPPDHCLFLLISSRPEHLLSTIRSRCMTVRFFPLSSDRMHEILTTRGEREPDNAQLIAAFSEGRVGSALNCDPTELKITLRQYWSLLFGKSHVSASEIMDISEGLVKSNQVQEAIHWFWVALRDVLIVSLDNSRAPTMFKDQEPALRKIAQKISPCSILPLMHELHQLERGQQRNLNVQIGLEQFFFHLHDRLESPRPQEFVQSPTVSSPS